MSPGELGVPALRGYVEVAEEGGSASQEVRSNGLVPHSRRGVVGHHLMEQWPLVPGEQGQPTVTLAQRGASDPDDFS